MKILLISTQDYIHHPVPSRHHYIFEELAKTHEVHVPHFHVSEGKERETLLHVHEATKYYTKSPLKHYLFNSPTHFKVIEEIVRDNDIDVIVTGHILAGTAAIRCGKKHNIPVVFDLKDWLPESAAAYYKSGIVKNMLRRGVWEITKYNLKHSSKIVTVSPSLVHLLKERGFESQLITNGVNTDIFVPMDGNKCRKCLGIPKDQFVIGFEGSIERFFALDKVISAMKEIVKQKANTTLLIVGGGLFTDYESELKQQVIDLGLGDVVKFTGTVPYSHLPHYISAMDVCCIPYADEEWVSHSLPNKFFEYSACGKPIISTPVPDVMSIQQGNVFPFSSYEEFVDLCLGFSTGIPEFKLDVRAYSWKKKAEEFESIFHKLINKNY
ncbi:MAG: glycosyltransferase family 4 protein [Methanogenium sp.]|jgi:glycosyltransferase involved in cell wall biosynthesis